MNRYYVVAIKAPCFRVQWLLKGLELDTRETVQPDMLGLVSFERSF